MLSYLKSYVFKMIIKKKHYDLDLLLDVTLSDMRYMPFQKRLFSSLYHMIMRSFNTETKKTKSLMYKSNSINFNHLRTVKNSSCVA